ncbi:MAG: FUSC family protein [Alicyclobacillaceae bacterium]|nr:FUSC family protein [Alicyclobacillaceae bacterium]
MIGKTNRILATITTRDKSQIHVQAGLQNACGVAVPLLLGLLVHQELLAIAPAVGALVVGFSGTSGTTRKRIRTMLLSSIWMSVATFVGTSLGHFLIAAIVLTVLSGFLAGWMVSISPEAAQIGVLASVALVIFTAFPANPLHSLEQMGLVLAGGLFQTLLLFVFSRFDRRPEERILVERVYASMATFARQRTRKADLAVSQAFQLADAALADSWLPGHLWIRLRRLLNEAEQLRNTLVALSLQTKGANFPSKPPAEGTNMAPFVGIEAAPASAHDTMFRTLGQIFDGVARQLEYSDAWSTASSAGFQHLDQLIARLAELGVPVSSVTTTNGFNASESPNLADTTNSVKAFLNILARVLEHLQDTISEPRPTSARPDGRWQPIQIRLTTLRANATLDSPAFRHALRLGITLGVAVVLYRLIPLPRGYWVPMTALLVLKPDFFSTIGRGLSRILGTVIGVIATSLLLAIPHHGFILPMILIVAFAIAMYAFIQYNYGVFSIFVTGEVVVLLSFFEHMTPAIAIRDRLLNTLIGAGIALVAYILWPTWQERNIPRTLAKFVQSERRYLEILLSAVDPINDSATVLGSPLEKQIADKRRSVRLTRTNAAATLHQAQSEPKAERYDAHAVLGILTAQHRATDALLALDQYISQPQRPTELASDSATFLRCLRDAARQMETLEHLLSATDSLPHAMPSNFLNELREHLNDGKQRDISSIMDGQLRMIALRLNASVTTSLRMMPLHKSNEHPIFLPSTSPSSSKYIP